MSKSARKPATGTFPSGVSAHIRSGVSGSGTIWTIWVEWIGERDRGDVPVGQDVHLVDAVGVQRGDGAAGGRAEPDDGGAQPAAVAAGDPGQCHGVQHGAVAGQLVVLVEDVQAEPAVGLPVVHRLERDQRQPPIDGDLSQGGILHAVRPAPDDLSRRISARSSAWTLGSTMTSQSAMSCSRVPIPPTNSASASSVAPNSAPYPCSRKIRGRTWRSILLKCAG